MATTDIPPHWRLRLRQYHRYVTYWRTQADADGEDRSADALPPPLAIDLWHIISHIGPRPDPEAQDEEEDWPAHWASNAQRWTASCRELRKAMDKFRPATGRDDPGGPSVQQDDGMDATNATTGEEGKCAPPKEAEKPEYLAASASSGAAEESRTSRSYTQQDMNPAQRPDLASSPSQLSPQRLPLDIARRPRPGAEPPACAQSAGPNRLEEPSVLDGAVKMSPFEARVDAMKKAREAILAKALTHDTAAKKTWRRSTSLADHNPSRCPDQEDSSVHSLEEEEFTGEEAPTTDTSSLVASDEGTAIQHGEADGGDDEQSVVSPSDERSANRQPYVSMGSDGRRNSHHSTERSVSTLEGRAEFSFSEAFALAVRHRKASGANS